jgi:hypothetical protein
MDRRKPLKLFEAGPEGIAGWAERDGHVAPPEI